MRGSVLLVALVACSGSAATIGGDGGVDAGRADGGVARELDGGPLVGPYVDASDDVNGDVGVVDADTPDASCDEGAKRCGGGGIQYCRLGVWQDLVDCPRGPPVQVCHCAAPGSSDCVCD